MHSPISIRVLSPAEQTGIAAGLHSSDAFTLRRCQILLASHRGQRPAEIARNLGCATRDPCVMRCMLLSEMRLECLKPESCRPKTVQAQFDQATCEARLTLLQASVRGRLTNEPVSGP